MIVFSSETVSNRTGVSLWQLQWWDEQGIIRPTHDRAKRGGGVPGPRCYSPAQLLEVRIVANCRARGLGLRAARNVLQAVRKADFKACLVLTDGKRVWVEPGGLSALARLKTARQGMWLIDVAALHALDAERSKAA